jgi:hypothetical protein
VPSIAACHVFSVSFLLYAQRLIVNRSAIVQPKNLEKMVKSHISADYIIQFMVPTYIINNKLLAGLIYSINTLKYKAHGKILRVNII